MNKLFTFSFFGGRLKFDFLFVAVLIVFGVLGYLKDFSIYFCSIIVHELGHIIAANGYGIKLEEIYILPFGCTQKFSSIGGTTYMQDIIISLMGPLVNLLVASAILFSNKYLGAFLNVSKAIEINLLLAAVNLFPALPLDGGRIMLALLSNFLKRSVANTIVSIAGMIFGISMLFFGVFLVLKNQFIVGLFIFGLFIFIGGFNDYKSKGYNIIMSLLDNDIAKRKAVNVKRVAIHKNSKVELAIKEFETGKYNIATVVDDDMKILGELNEREIINAIMDYGKNVAAKTVVKAKE